MKIEDVKIGETYRDVVSGEATKVLGFAEVETGIAGSDRWPLEVETWCVYEAEWRSREHSWPKQDGRMLTHPSRLEPLS